MLDNYTKVKRNLLEVTLHQLSRAVDSFMSKCNKCNSSGVCPDCQAKIYSIYRYLNGAPSMAFCPQCVQGYNSGKLKGFNADIQSK